MNIAPAIYYCKGLLCIITKKYHSIITYVLFYINLQHHHPMINCRNLLKERDQLTKISTYVQYV